MSSTKIVGIIGAGGWAEYGHNPALHATDEFEVVSVSSRTRTTAAELAKNHGIPHAFDDCRKLAEHPNVCVADLVQDGYIGTIRGARRSLGVDALGPKTPQHVRLHRLIDRVAAASDQLLADPRSLRGGD